MTGCWEEIRCILTISPIYWPWESKGSCGSYIKGLKMEWHFYFFSPDLILSALIPMEQLVSSTKVCLPSLHCLAFITLCVCMPLCISTLWCVCVCVHNNRCITGLFVCCLSNKIALLLIWQDSHYCKNTGSTGRPSSLKAPRCKE